MTGAWSERSCVRRTPFIVAVSMAVAATSCATVPQTQSDEVGQVVFFRPLFCEFDYVDSHGLPPAPGPLSQESCSSELLSQYAVTSRVDDTANATVFEPTIDHDARFVLGPADLTSSDLVGAWAQSQGDGLAVVIAFNSGALDRLRAMTSSRSSSYSVSPDAVGSIEAIDVNTEVVAYARILEPTDSTCIEITGRYGKGMSSTDADNLVAEIRGAAQREAQPASPQCLGEGPSFTLD